jgi:hypothetical protein
MYVCIRPVSLSLHLLQSPVVSAASVPTLHSSPGGFSPAVPPTAVLHETYVIQILKPVHHTKYKKNSKGANGKIHYTLEYARKTRFANSAAPLEALWL